MASGNVEDGRAMLLDMTVDEPDEQGAGIDRVVGGQLMVASAPLGPELSQQSRHLISDVASADPEGAMFVVDPAGLFLGQRVVLETDEADEREDDGLGEGRIPAVE